MRVALATCNPRPQHAADDPLLLDALSEAGVTAELLAWDDATVDWSAFDLVVIRSTWDYPGRRDEYVNWAHSVPRLANPSSLVEWNTDKVYLQELAAVGIPVVPTEWFREGDPVGLRSEWSEFVVKPSVSAGAADTNRYGPGDEDRALAHLSRLADAGRTAMLQPYLAGVDRHGETALIFFDGVFSHAMRKGPLLSLGGEALTGATYREQMVPREPTPAERELAARVLEAIPLARPPLYARIDLLPGEDGQPVLIEAELTEPSLFLDFVEGSARRFVEAILLRV